MVGISALKIEVVLVDNDISQKNPCSKNNDTVEAKFNIYSNSKRKTCK